MPAIRLNRGSEFAYVCFVLVFIPSRKVDDGIACPFNFKVYDHSESKLSEEAVLVVAAKLEASEA